MRPEKYPSSTIIASHDEQKLQLSININYSEHKEIQKVLTNKMSLIESQYH